MGRKSDESARAKLAFSRLPRREELYVWISSNVVWPASSANCEPTRPVIKRSAEELLHKIHSETTNWTERMPTSSTMAQSLPAVGWRPALSPLSIATKSCAIITLSSKDVDAPVDPPARAIIE